MLPAGEDDDLRSIWCRGRRQATGVRRASLFSSWPCLKYLAVLLSGALFGNAWPSTRQENSPDACRVGEDRTATKSSLANMQLVGTISPAEALRGCYHSQAAASVDECFILVRKGWPVLFHKALEAVATPGHTDGCTRAATQTCGV